MCFLEILFSFYFIIHKTLKSYVSKNTSILLYWTNIDNNKNFIVQSLVLTCRFKKKTVYCLYYSSFSFSKEIKEDYKKNIGIIDLCSSVKIITVSFFTIVLCIEITFHYFNIYITIKEL